MLRVNNVCPCASEVHETNDCEYQNRPNVDNYLCCNNCKKAVLSDQMKSQKALSIFFHCYQVKQKKFKAPLSYYNQSKN